MKIITEELTEYYLDRHGNTVLISVQPDGSAVLVRHDGAGEIIGTARCKSRKRAFLAMCFRYGRCRFHHYVQRISKV